MGRGSCKNVVFRAVCMQLQQDQDTRSVVILDVSLQATHHLVSHVDREPSTCTNRSRISQHVQELYINMYVRAPENSRPCNISSPGTPFVLYSETCL